MSMTPEMKRWRDNFLKIPEGLKEKKMSEWERTSYPTKRIAESLLEDGKGAIANEAIMQLADDYLAADAEITRLKEELAECKSDVKHWINEAAFQKRKALNDNKQG